jgi:hypothetical protein
MNGSAGALTLIRQWRIIELRWSWSKPRFFTRQIAALLTEEEYRGFQFRIAANPELGALIKGGAGIRKIRVAVGARGKGGGARVIYYWAMRDDVILLLYAYSKNEAVDLTPRQIAQLAKIVKQEFAE